MPDTTTAVRGRNEPTGADAAQTFEDRIKALVNAANAWAKEVPAIESAEQAGRCEDLIGQCREEYAAVDAARKEARRPHDEAVAGIQARFNPLLDLLKASGAVLNTLKARWLALVEERQAEERRKAEAAAQRAREDAEMAEASAAAGLGRAVDNAIAAAAARKRAADAAEAAQRAARAKPQVVGEMGGRASGFRTEWSAEIIDVVAALEHYADHVDLRVTLQKIANADARRLKAQLSVPGVRAVSKKVV
jgi:hypothetical protein